MTYYAYLPDRAVLAVSGDDARTFLQGLITHDIRKATTHNALFAALLSPQGKFLYDFFILEHQGSLLLETNKARLPALTQRLAMYRLRAHVEFTELPAMQVAALWGNPAPEIRNQIHFADPRLPALGGRIIGTELQLPYTAGNYEHHRLSLGIPEGSKDLLQDRSLLLEYGYDKLHGVDFTKGCYVGQEVTARSKHRATLHKYIHSVTAEEPLPPPGTPVTANGHDIGEMRSSAGTIGLALLRTKEAEEAARAGIELTSAGVIVRARPTEWSGMVH